MNNAVERVNELLEYQIMDTEEEADFNEIVELASKICGAPTSLITLLDHHRQWFKAKIGMTDTETPIEFAFCKYAIEQEKVFIVEDATKDNRFSENPYVTGDTSIRFYAGMPLQTPRGINIGTLCVIDKKPRTISVDQQQALRILGHQVVKLFELNRAKLNQEAANKILQESSNALQKLVNFRERVFSIISHDLRGPIGSIGQVLDLFNTGMITADEFTEVVPRLTKQVSDAKDVLNNLLSWANSNKPGLEPEKKMVDVNQTINTLVNSLQTDAQKKQVRLVFEPRELTESMSLDKDALLIVLRNLIKNSIKFCNANDTITVTCNLVANNLRFAVKDTGVGFNDAVAAKFFNESDHVTTFGTANEKGTGLGLLICKNLVEQNGGKIWAESTLGEGASFYFTFVI